MHILAFSGAVERVTRRPLDVEGLALTDATRRTRCGIFSVGFIFYNDLLSQPQILVMRNLYYAKRWSHDDWAIFQTFVYPIQYRTYLLDKYTLFLVREKAISSERRRSDMRKVKQKRYVRIVTSGKSSPPGNIRDNNDALTCALHASRRRVSVWTDP